MLLFNFKFMACLFPFYVNDKPVPCGRCPNCLIRRTDSWVFRIMYEERDSISSHWLTLTYDDIHVPITDNGFMSLNKRHVQLFFKRLRRAMPVGHKPIKYYLCGEYGGRFGRPHYHVLVLNADERFFCDSWCDEETGAQRGDVYIDPRPISADSIAYTVGYMNKPKVARHARADWLPEFSLMSKRLGIGYVLNQDNVKYHYADDSRNFVTLPGGKRSALPRYYADKLFKPKAVNGFVCPVAVLAANLRKESAEATLEAGVRRSYRDIYQRHIDTYGNADDFVRSQGEARRAAVINFRKRNSKRKDL